MTLGPGVSATAFVHLRLRKKPLINPFHRDFENLDVRKMAFYTTPARFFSWTQKEI